MKIRLISDLHIDINHDYPLSLDDDGIYTLVAGDVSGSPTGAVEWMKKNVHRGAFVSGNHDVYDTDLPIEEVKEMLHREFGEDNSLTYFDNDVGVISKEIEDGILLVADVMYTDYALPIPWRNYQGDVKCNLMIADPSMNRHGGMNDFVYGKCKKKYDGVNDWRSKRLTRDDVWRLVPQWYAEHNERAFKKITEVVEQAKDKQIILMTHHGLSPKCLDDNYRENSDMDACYTSDKEDWIKAYPSIKCIVSGHVHCRKQFKVGECLYVMNALGYCHRHLRQYDLDTEKYEQWTPDCFIDTSTWTVEWKHHDNEAWEKQWKKDSSPSKFMFPLFT